jgi:hypothetical protein
MSEQLAIRTLAECEAVIEAGLTTFVEVGEALLHIRDNRLYRQGHRTFEVYCRERWGFSKVRATQLITAAETVTAVTTPATRGRRRARRRPSVASRSPRGSSRRRSTLNVPAGRLRPECRSELDHARKSCFAEEACGFLLRPDGPGTEPPSTPRAPGMPSNVFHALP